MEGPSENSPLSLGDVKCGGQTSAFLLLQVAREILQRAPRALRAYVSFIAEECRSPYTN